MEKEKFIEQTKKRIIGKAKNDAIKQKLSNKDNSLVEMDEEDTKISKSETKDDQEDTEETKELVEMVKEDLKESESMLSTNIERMSDYLKSYIDDTIKSDDTTLDYNLIYTNCDMLLALQYVNKINVKFIGSNEGDIAGADILSKCAEYDFENELNMDFINLACGFDKFLIGPGQYIFNGFNKNTLSPILKAGNVEDWRPDPTGRGHADNFRYMGYRGAMTKDEMRKLGNFFNIDKIVDTQTTDSDKKLLSSNISTYTGLSENNKKYRLYDHFLQSDGSWYLVTLANNLELPVRVVKLGYDKIPVSLDYFKPQKGNPHGIVLPTLSRKKQKNLGILLDLMIKKAIRSSLGNHLLVDPSLLHNKNELKQLTTVPKIISIKTGGNVSPQNIVSELQRSQVPNDNLNVQNVIKQLNYEEVGISATTLGVGDGSSTATETVENAKNSNIRFSFGNRISFIFWKDFWNKRLMMYQQHYPEDGEKVLIISGDIADRYMVFKKKNIQLSQNPRIKLVSKMEYEANNKEQIQLKSGVYTLMMQFRAIPKPNFAQRYTIRDLLRTMNYEEDKIARLVGDNWDEMTAKNDLGILNNGDALAELTSDQIGEEHEVYIEYYKQAKEGVNKTKSIQERLMALKQRKKMEDKGELTPYGQAPQPASQTNPMGTPGTGNGSAPNPQSAQQSMTI